MRILICGDREWNDLETMAKVFEWIIMQSPPPIIIHGACRGADEMADACAKMAGLRVVSFPAHWSHSDVCPPNCKQKIGRGAGPIRNRKMLNEGKPSLVFIFHNNIEHSKGSKDMFDQALQDNILTYVVTSTKLPDFIG